MGAVVRERVKQRVKLLFKRRVKKMIPSRNNRLRCNNRNF